MTLLILQPDHKRFIHGLHFYGVYNGAFYSTFIHITSIDVFLWNIHQFSVGAV